MGNSVIESRQAQRIKKDEEELAAMIANAEGKSPDNTEELDGEKQTEVKVKEEKNNAEPVKEPKGETPPEEPDEGNFKKRYGDLRRHSQAKEAELKARIEELEAKTPKFVPPASDEELGEWKKKYPDVASIVETLAMKIADEKLQETKADIEEFRTEKKASEKEKAKAAIREAHPDFDTITESDEFHDWADSQPKWIQNALFENSDDARSVIGVLKLYKLDQDIKDAPKEERKAAKDAAKEVKTKTKVALEENANKVRYTESQVQKMSMEEFAKHEAAIDAAMRSGEFVHDLSGGAR